MDKMINHQDKRISTTLKETNHNSDIQIALQLIINRFSLLEEEITSKNKNIKDNEVYIYTLSEQMRCIREENIQTLNENKYLKELCAKLKEDNVSLMKLRSRVINSFKNEDVYSDNYEIIFTENDQYASLKKNNDNNDRNKINVSTACNNKYLSSDGNKNNPTYKLNPTNEDTIENTSLTESKDISFAGNTSKNADEIMNKIKDKYNRKSDTYEETANSNKTSFKIEGRINELKNKLNIKNHKNLSNAFDPKYPEKMDTSVVKHNDELSNSPGTTNKSKQYILSLKFFNNCRILLDDKSYHNLISTLIEKNNNQDHIYSKVREILGRQPGLCKDFEEIFPTLSEDIYNYLKKT